MVSELCVCGPQRGNARGIPYQSREERHDELDCHRVPAVPGSLVLGDEVRLAITSAFACARRSFLRLAGVNCSCFGGLSSWCSSLGSIVPCIEVTGSSKRPSSDCGLLACDLCPSCGCSTLGAAFLCGSCQSVPAPTTTPDVLD